MIRTTISLREDIYDNLRRLAAVKRMSFSGVVNAKLAGGPLALSENEVSQKIKESREFFRKLALRGKPEVDTTRAVREMRDDRMERIAGNAGI